MTQPQTTASDTKKAGKEPGAAAGSAAAPNASAASKKNEGPAHYETPDQVPQAEAPPPDWLTFDSNRLIFKPDLCHEHAVRGYVLDYQEMPPVDDRAWAVYIIKLTHATVGCDRDDNIFAANAGDEIMVPEVYSLQNCPALRALAQNPNETCEVYLKAVDKEKIGGGRTLWRYKISFNPKRQKREGALRLFQAATGIDKAVNAAGANPAMAAPPI